MFPVQEGLLHEQVQRKRAQGAVVTQTSLKHDDAIGTQQWRIMYAASI